jgi:DNA-binding transcriptional ArsR family regulator
MHYSSGVKMTGSEEETYSIMFSSLKHPARRKILRMLSEKTLTFSQMLEELAIPSSHLTYHLENLGELVVKEDDGKYKLSSFGKASVSMMKGAEEVPDAHANRFSALPLRWKSFLVIFTIAVVLLASMLSVQYASFSQLTSDYSGLKANYDRVAAENQQLLSWNGSASKAMSMLRGVIQLNVSKYQGTLISNTVEDRMDLGGVIEEVSKYRFVSEVSRIELSIRFRNNHFSDFQISQIEGLPNFPPYYTGPQSTNILQAARSLVERYRNETGNSYLDDMIRLLASANDSSIEQTSGNTKLIVSSYGGNAKITLQYTAGGYDFATKSLSILSQNNIITELSDDWMLYNIGSTQVNATREQAIQIAKTAAEKYSWTANGTQVSSFKILDSPVSAEFYPHPRQEKMTLFPYWYVTLHLDKVYPGGVGVIAVGVWADTGEVANIEALSGTSA